MSGREIGILGFAHAVPDTVRRNDDPLFAGERALTGAEELFSGYRERRVLQPGERLEELAERAARGALADAGVEPGAIDRLYGAVSPSTHLVPSGLFAVHHALGLRCDAAVIPIHSDFTNVDVALTAAWEAVAAGRCERALVVVAAGWSRLVDYSDPGALGIGDGAGALVVGRGGPLRFVDEVTETHSAWRDAMTVRVRAPRAGGDVRPVFVFEGEGSSAFRALSVEVPARLFRTLLERNRLDSSEVALIAHQASQPLLDAWQRELRPAELPTVMETYGNATLATTTITLSTHRHAIQSPYIVLLTLGCGQNFSALLLARAPA